MSETGTAFQSMIEEYKDHLMQEHGGTLSNYHAHAYRLTVSTFCPVVGEEDADSLTPKQLGDLLFHKLGVGTRSSQYVRIFTKHAYDYHCRKTGMYRNPMDYVPAFYRRNNVISRLCDSDIQKLKDNASKMSYPSMSRLFLETGLPISHLFPLQESDVDFSQHQLHIRRKYDASDHGTLKTVIPLPQEQVIPISLETEAILKEAIEKRKEIKSDSKFLFLTAFNTPYGLAESTQILFDFRIITGNAQVNLNTVRCYIAKQKQNERKESI